MHDSQLVDVLHAGRDVLEAKQHAALRPPPPVFSRPSNAIVPSIEHILLGVLRFGSNGRSMHAYEMM